MIFSKIFARTNPAYDDDDLSDFKLALKSVFSIAYLSFLG